MDMSFVEGLLCALAGLAVVCVLEAAGRAYANWAVWGQFGESPPPGHEWWRIWSNE